MRVLVTGAAGFIGFHTAKSLLDRGDEVIGLDNLNAYYDVRLKEARLGQLRPQRLHLPQAGPCRPNADGTAIRRDPSAARDQSRRPGRRALWHGNPHDYVDTNISGPCMCWKAAATTASSIWSTRVEFGLRR